MIMTRRTTIHELAETLSKCCSDATIADLMEATLSAAMSADDNARLSVYQANLAEALFESLTELRPDCVKLAQERPESRPKRSLWRWLVPHK